MPSPSGEPLFLAAAMDESGAPVIVSQPSNAAGAPGVPVGGGGVAAGGAGGASAPIIEYGNPNWSSAERLEVR
jgi:hypothetical protein